MSRFKKKLFYFGILVFCFSSLCQLGLANSNRVYFIESNLHTKLNKSDDHQLYTDDLLIGNESVTFYTSFKNNSSDSIYCKLLWFVDGVYKPNKDIYFSLVGYESGRYIYQSFSLLGGMNHTIIDEWYVEENGNWKYINSASFSGFWSGSPNMSIERTAGVEPQIARDPFTVSYYIKNSGNANNDSIVVTLKKQKEDESVFSYLTEATVYNIKAGQPERKESISYNGKLEKGRYRFKVKLPNTSSATTGWKDFTGEPIIKFSGLSINPFSPAVGGEFTVSYTIENSGNAATENLSVTLTVDGYSKTVHPNNLPPETSRPESITVKAGDANISAGEHTITISSGDVSASLNNITWKEPDIRIESINSIDPNRPEALKPFTVYYTVKNHGDLASAGYSVDLKVNGATKTESRSALAAGAIRNESISYENDSLKAGNEYTIRIQTGTSYQEITRTWHGTPDVKIIRIDKLEDIGGSDPNKLEALKDCKVYFTLKNDGNADATDWPIETWVDGVQWFDDFGEVLKFNIAAESEEQEILELAGVGLNAGSHTIQLISRPTSGVSSDSKQETWYGPEIDFQSIDEIDPDPPIAMESFDLICTLKNTGNEAVQNMVIHLYKDDDVEPFGSSTVDKPIPASTSPFELTVTVNKEFERGEHTIYLEADVEDSNLNDNFTPPETYDWLARADIEIAGIDEVYSAGHIIPPEALDPFVVVYTMKNNGDLDAGNVKVILQIQDINYTYSDIVNVPAGFDGQKELYYNFSGPRVGTHSVKVESKYDDWKNENNSFVDDFTWVGTPEVKIASVDQINTDQALEDCTISFTIENIGNADSAPVQVKLFCDGSFKKSKLCSLIGARSSRTETITVPGGFEYGSHLIKIVYNNSYATNTFFWKGEPDVKIVSVDSRTPADALEPCTVGFTVYNSGNKFATNWPIDIIIDGDSQNKTTKIFDDIAARYRGPLAISLTNGVPALKHTVKIQSKDSYKEKDFTWYGSEIDLVNVIGIEPDPPVADAECSLKLSVRNDGNRNVDVLPVDVFLDSGTEPFATLALNEQIYAGYNSQATLTFSDGFSVGNHSLKLVSKIKDSNPDNDTLEANFEWGQNPEITVFSVDSINPNDALAPCTVTFTLKNDGADAGYMPINIYIDDQYLDSVTCNENIVAGYDSQATFSYDSFPAGPHLLKVEADITDSFPDDNYAEDSFEWFGSPEIKIYPGTLDVSTDVADAPCKISFTIENYGNADAVNWEIEALLDNDNYGWGYFNTIPAGKILNEIKNVSWGFPEGTYTLTIKSGGTDSDPTDDEISDSFTWHDFDPEIKMIEVKSVSTDEAWKLSTVKFLVWNSGDATAGNLPVKISIDNVDIKTVKTVEEITAGYSREATIFFSQGFPAGKHKLKLTAQVQDNNLTDNSAEYEFTWKLPAPQNLTVLEMPGETSLRLTWTGIPADYITGYRIYRKKETDTAFTKIANVAAGKQFYEDRSVTLGEYYTYYVTAYDAADEESAASNKDSNSPKLSLLEVVAPKTETPAEIQPLLEETVDITWQIAKVYRLDYPKGVVRLQIINADTQEKVYELDESVPLPSDKGIRTFSWNGKKEDGSLVMGGVYTTFLTLFSKPGGGQIADVAEPRNIIIGYEIKINIGVDGDRDGTIDFDNPDDKKLIFWINDDHDISHEVDKWVHPNVYIVEEDDVEVSLGDEDHNNDYIGDSAYPFKGKPCKRDLEDFNRIHISLESIDLLNYDYYDLKCYMYFRNSSHGFLPKINIFKAVEIGNNYLNDETVADNQIKEKKLLTIGDAPVELPEVIVKNMLDGSNNRTPFIFEGCSSGEGELVISLEVNGTVLCEADVFIDLNKVKFLYEKYTVGDGNSCEEPNTVPVRMDTFEYPTPQNYDEQTYFLIVHGWNVPSWEKNKFAETAYKRLYWQGYRGRFGFFRWPTIENFPDWGSFPPTSYNKSEFRAWKSAEGLLNLMQQLKQKGYYIYLYAHSMGNLVAGEALRRYGLTDPPTPIVEKYIATQAAVPTQFYHQDFEDPTLIGPDNLEIKPWKPNSFGPETPNCCAFYFSGGIFNDANGDNLFSDNEDLWEDVNGGEDKTYDDGTDTKLYNGTDGWNTPDGTIGKKSSNPYFNNNYMLKASKEFINFYNPWDYALRSWWANNVLKPDGPTYDFTMEEGFERNPLGPFNYKKLWFEEDKYEIFTFCDESRVHPLGASGNVQGPFNNNEQINMFIDFNFNHLHPGHSKQFRSYIQKQKIYWKKILDKIK